MISFIASHLFYLIAFLAACILGHKLDDWLRQEEPEEE